MSALVHWCDECGDCFDRAQPICRGATCRARVCRRCRDAEGVCRSCVRESAGDFVAILLCGIAAPRCSVSDEPADECRHMEADDA